MPDEELAESDEVDTLLDEDVDTGAIPELFEMLSFDEVGNTEEVLEDTPPDTLTEAWLDEGP